MRTRIGHADAMTWLVMMPLISVGCLLHAARMFHIVDYRNETFDQMVRLWSSSWKLQSCSLPGLIVTIVIIIIIIVITIIHVVVVTRSSVASDHVTLCHGNDTTLYATFRHSPGLRNSLTANFRNTC